MLAASIFEAMKQGKGLIDFVNGPVLVTYPNNFQIFLYRKMSKYVTLLGNTGDPLSSDYIGPESGNVLSLEDDPAFLGCK